MSSPAENFDPASLGIAPEETPAAKPVKRKASRRSTDQLGIVWLHGVLHFGVLRQRKMLAHWSAPDPVRTVPEFSAALAAALGELEFVGTETFLVFEGEQFVHQTETAPAFSAHATRHYLQGRVDRWVKEHEPVLWVAQPAFSAKEDRAFILHLLPQAFYAELNTTLRANRLDLTRILPMTVPVLREMNGFPVSKGEPVLAAVETANATLVVVARTGGPILFSRSILASLDEEPARIAVEINRSLLYARQQFSVSVDRIWLLSRRGRAVDDVKAKCGAGKMVLALPTQAEEWLQTVTRVPANQPINLLASYLEKKQRQQLLRRALIAACWVGLTWLSLDAWSRQTELQETAEAITGLHGREPALISAEQVLSTRNTSVDRAEEFLRRLQTDKLPAVPAKFLSYLATVLPTNMRLTDFSVRWDPETRAWSFQCEGQIAADEDGARETLTNLQRHLARSPFRARFSETARAAGTSPVGTAATEGDLQRFNLEGTVLEN